MESVRQKANQDYVDNLDLKVFDILKDLKERPNFAMSITAKRNSGKSVLMKDLCYQIKNWYANVYVFSQTAKLQPDLFSYIDEDNIIDGFNENALREVWQAQYNQVMKLKKMGVAPDKIPKVLILFDDIIGDPRVRNSKILNDFFIQGRHLHFGVMIITQELGGKGGLPKVVRANLDCAVAFFLNNEYDRKLFVDQYLSTKNALIGHKIFDRVCHKEYQAIVVLNYITDPNPENYIRTYVASPKVPKFKMGNRKLKEATWIPNLLNHNLVNSKKMTIDIKITK